MNFEFVSKARKTGRPAKEKSSLAEPTPRAPWDWNTNGYTSFYSCIPSLFLPSGPLPSLFSLPISGSLVLRVSMWEWWCLFQGLNISFSFFSFPFYPDSVTVFSWGHVHTSLIWLTAGTLTWKKVIQLCYLDAGNQAAIPDCKFPSDDMWITSTTRFEITIIEPDPRRQSSRSQP